MILYAENISSQHEQLRTVISRVLRPSGLNAEDKPSHDAAGAGDAEKMLALNVGDSSAIDQINMAYENVKEVDCLDVSNDGVAAWEAALRRYLQK